MLGLLAWKRRFRALVIVAIYSLCLIAPTVSLAFADPAASAHCLNGDHGGASAFHGDHTKAKGYQFGDPPGEPDEATKCCGLFGFSAIAPTVDFTINRPMPISPGTALTPVALSGRASDRIDRPPKSHPSH